MVAPLRGAASNPTVHERERRLTSAVTLTPLAGGLFSRKRGAVAALCAGALTLLAVPPLAPRAAAKEDPLAGIKHIVVIFEENRSFDNVYGGWPGVDGVAKSTVKQVGAD